VLAGFFSEKAAELAAMADEAALSRLYRGIHYGSDNELGLMLGRRVGPGRAARIPRRRRLAEPHSVTFVTPKS
jgi:hypothetical protein